MTEHEWLGSDDPHVMLRYLTHGWYVGISIVQPVLKQQISLINDRKLRLFACALRRQDSSYKWDGVSQGWLQVENYPHEKIPLFADGSGEYPPIKMVDLFIDSVSPKLSANLLREIVVNPFRPIEIGSGNVCGPRRYGDCNRWEGHEGQHTIRCSRFDKAWFTSTVKRIAQFVHDNQAFDDMPILGDALEEAGCTNEHILRHCRQQEVCPVCEGFTARARPLFTEGE